MRSQFEIWSFLRVSEKSIYEIHDFFRNEYNVSPKFILSKLHLTVYHSRRPMPNLQESDEICYHSIGTLDTRFMVLAPGGENPRPDLIPAQKKIGIRIKKDSEFRTTINEYRNLLLMHESSRVLGIRKPSSNTRNAFGARNFQPHISFLKAGSGVKKNLTEIGENFRNTIQEIYFDKFIVQKRRNF
jgi:hypothetical protein